MKHVNTIQMEELSDAQILAARKRRSKERSGNLLCTCPIHRLPGIQRLQACMGAAASSFSFQVLLQRRHLRQGSAGACMQRSVICQHRLSSSRFDLGLLNCCCRDVVTKVDIDKLELPDNHPFAVKKKVRRQGKPFPPASGWGLSCIPDPVLGSALLSGSACGPAAE